MNQGVPRDGYDFFDCDACLEELGAMIEKKIRERNGKLFARHMNN